MKKSLLCIVLMVVVCTVYGQNLGQADNAATYSVYASADNGQTNNVPPPIIIPPVVISEKHEKIKMFEAGLEAGYNGYGDSVWDAKGNADYYMQLLNTKGWISSTETHATYDQHIYGDLYGQVKFNFLAIGTGIRYFDLGSISVTAVDQIGVQYIKLTDSVSNSVFSPYVYAGFCHDALTLKAEAGLAYASWADNLELTGYNNNTFDNYLKYTADGSGSWYSFTAQYDIKSDGWFCGLSLGYKINRFEKYVISKVDTNFSTLKQGDTLTGHDGSPYKTNLDGVFGAIRLGWIF